MPCITVTFDLAKGPIWKIGLRKPLSLIAKSDSKPAESESTAAAADPKTIVPGPKRETLFAVDALFDTGASHTCVVDEVAKQIGLPVVSKTTMISASGKEEVNVYLADFAFPFGALGSSNEVHVPDILITEFRSDGKDFQVLLGRDILCLGAFQMVGYDRRFMFCV